MSTQKQDLPPSPLLERIRITTVGVILISATKENLTKGYQACRSNSLRQARWNEERTALDVSFKRGITTTFQLDGMRVVTSCSCSIWQPARNCPHVVLVWATLKRLLTPNSFNSIAFDPTLLQEMKTWLEQPAEREEPLPAESGDSSSPLDVTRPVRSYATTATPLATYRLVLEKSIYGSGVNGSIRRGLERVLGGTAMEIPADLASFLSIHGLFDGSPRYLEQFQQLTGHGYPILFRHPSGRETPLSYQQDQTGQPSITFDLRGETVQIARTLEHGTTLPESAIISGDLLYDIDAGVILRLADYQAWNTWNVVCEELSGISNLYFDDERDQTREPKSKQQRRTGIMKRGQHSMVVSRDHFISTAIRFSEAILDPSSSNCHFLVDGVADSSSHPHLPSYQVDIPQGVQNSTSTLIPLLTYHDIRIHFPTAVCWYFNSAPLSRLPAPLKTRKRIKAILETAFMLMNEQQVTPRTRIIRSITSSPDFAKREIKRKGKQLLLELEQSWHRSLIIALPSEHDWVFIHEDRRMQIQLLRILYDRFGLDPFLKATLPGALEVPLEICQKELPTLMTELQQHGFSLRVGSQPTAMATWEFSLDATSSSLDWFELKPEIRCNGTTLTPQEMQRLLTGNGLLERDGKLMLLDEISAQVLAMFTGAMPSLAGKKKRKGEQDLVRVPRLQILDWLQLRKHGVEIKLAPEDARLLENLLNFSSIPDRRLPQALNATLRHYQVEAWQWLAFLYEHRFGACLADDMGLGKTVQGITLLAGVMSGEIRSQLPSPLPHLVVAPPSLLFNWEAELARFLPTARVMLYTGSGRRRDNFANFDVIITSYGIVQRDAELLAKLRFNIMIFDEAQSVKNLQAATSNAVRKLNGAFTLALTGTPVENHLGEYFAIMDLCLPGLLGTREEFSRTLGKDEANGTNRLIGRTRPFVLRRTKQLIASELPPKIEIDIPLELSSKQKAFYQRTVEEVRSQVKEAYDSHAPAQARIIALTAILRLRQICLAPALASPGASDESPKLLFLTEQLAELREEGHSVLVFSQFTGYLDLVQHGLLKAGFNCLRLDGSTPVPQRKQLVQSFQNGTVPMVFLISLKAGGKGLNLTRATYVYHLDPWWNPAVENQASDRAHRIGQTEQVTITRLIMRHTIEEKMMALKEQKTRLYKAILEDGAGGAGAGLTREDFDFLLG